jgi:hypothetical protein
MGSVLIKAQLWKQRGSCKANFTRAESYFIQKKTSFLAVKFNSTEAANIIFRNSIISLFMLQILSRKKPPLIKNARIKS